MEENTAEKICSKCGLPKPATLEFYSKDKGKLRAQCKACEKAAKDAKKVTPVQTSETPIGLPSPSGPFPDLTVTEAETTSFTQAWVVDKLGANPIDTGSPADTESVTAEGNAIDAVQTAIPVDVPVTLPDSSQSEGETPMTASVLQNPVASMLDNLGIEVPGMTTQPQPFDLETAIVFSITLKKFGESGSADLDAVTVTANKERLSLSKKLFDSPAYKEIRSHDVLIRRYIGEQALPGNNMFKSGMYILSPDMVAEIDDHVQEMLATRLELIDNFMATYPDLIEAAKIDLGDLFNEADYPDPATVRAAFIAETNYFHIRKPDALAKISQKIFEREQAKHAQALDDTIALVEQTLYYQLNKMVDGLLEKLQPGNDGKQKQIQNRAYEKLAAFLDDIKKRNITKDKKLTDLADLAKAALAGTNPAELKASATARETLTATFAQVKETLSGEVIAKPSRVIKFKDNEN